MNTGDSPVYHSWNPPGEAERFEDYSRLLQEEPVLRVDDTVIMFMIPVKQSLVTQNKREVFREVQRVTIAVTAQYKIENAVVTVDDI